MAFNDRYMSNGGQPRYAAAIRYFVIAIVVLILAKVSEIYDKYSHNGDLSSGVQTALTKSSKQ